MGNYEESLKFFGKKRKNQVSVSEKKRYFGTYTEIGPRFRLPILKPGFGRTLTVLARLLLLLFFNTDHIFFYRCTTCQLCYAPFNSQLFVNISRNFKPLEPISRPRCWFTKWFVWNSQKSMASVSVSVMASEGSRE